MPTPRPTTHSVRTRIRFNWGYRDGWLAGRRADVAKPALDPERSKDRIYRKAWLMGCADATQPLDLETAWRKYIDKTYTAQV